MPNLGELRRGCELGLANKRGLYLYHACVTCGKERWVRRTYGKPESQRCSPCAHKFCAHSGAAHSGWKGGRHKDPQGYIKIYLNPSDCFYPMADTNHYVSEHRLVMAKHLGRCLESWEIVHHRNGVRDDNQLGNLQLLPGREHHIVDTQLKNLIRRQGKLIKGLQTRITLLEAELVMIQHNKPSLLVTAGDDE